MNYEFNNGQEYTLYGKASTGKVKLWKIRVTTTPVAFTEDGTAFVNYSEDDVDKYDRFDTAGVIEMDNGYVDGNLNTSYKAIVEGKNLGKKNATTPVEQAWKEAAARIEKKLKHGYRFTTGELDELPVGPMLAQKYQDAGHKLEYPCAVQPKLNGVRCLAHKVDETTMEYRSKRGEEYTTLSHLDCELLPRMSVGEVWDGEVYVHGWSLQRINSAVKKANEDTPNLEYHVYDMISEISPFEMRYDHIMRCVLSGETDNLKLVPCGQINDEDGVEEASKDFLDQKYEGIMLRNLTSLYKCGFRSADLQKYKPVEDAEFEIVGYTYFDVYLGNNKEPSKAIVFICKTESGETFEVVPKGTMDERVMMYQNATDYVGKDLTVQYAELSDDGKPLQPIGICVRDYE